MQKTMSEYYILTDRPFYKEYRTSDITSGEPIHINHCWSEHYQKWFTCYESYKFDDLWIVIYANDVVYWKYNTDHIGYYIIPRCRKL